MGKLKIRSFVKLPGSKYKLLDFILSKLPAGKVLMEPFVGSGAIFLNSNYEHYILNDVNTDLINLYKTLQQHKQDFIDFCRQYFCDKNNTANQYYKFREQFNAVQDDIVLRSALFLYLNKHGYNGLCRFNQSNKFNVPFGRYSNLKFPEEAMKKFCQKANKAKFINKNFTKVLESKNIGSDTVIYCDPPYVPWSDTANFVAYQAQGFDFNNQQILADLAVKLSIKGITVLISNHFTNVTKKLYANADKLVTCKVKRMISCKAANRNYVTEVLAIYNDRRMQ